MVIVAKTADIQYLAGCYDGLFDSIDFMTAQIIHHNDITRIKGRYKTLLLVFFELFLASWAGQKRRNRCSVCPDGRNNGCGFACIQRRIVILLQRMDSRLLGTTELLALATSSHINRRVVSKLIENLQRDCGWSLSATISWQRRLNQSTVSLTV